MLVFLDAEFTKLHRDGKLISIALVAENGKRFYAEFIDYMVMEVENDDWIMNNVIANLKFTSLGDTIEYWRDKDYARSQVIVNESDSFEMVGGSFMIREELRKWLLDFEDITIVSDIGHYNFMFFIDMFGGASDLPYNVCPTYIELNTIVADRLGIPIREAFDYPRRSLINRLGGMSNLIGLNNSLYDAEGTKDLYFRIKENAYL